MWEFSLSLFLKSCGTNIVLLRRTFRWYIRELAAITQNKNGNTHVFSYDPRHINTHIHTCTHAHKHVWYHSTISTFCRFLCVLSVYVHILPSCQKFLCKRNSCVPTFWVSRYFIFRRWFRFNGACRAFYVIHLLVVTKYVYYYLVLIPSLRCSCMVT